MIQPRLIQRAQMSTRLPRDFEFVHFNALGWCQRPAAGLFLRDCVTQVCRCSVICPLPALVTRFVWVVCHCVYVLSPPNKITRANSRPAFQFDVSWFIDRLFTGVCMFYPFGLELGENFLCAFSPRFIGPNASVIGYSANGQTV